LPDFFLYVGRFSREKSLPTLIDAFSDYLSIGGKWDLIIIGSGPDETVLKNRANCKIKMSIRSVASG
jgi:glycosyltransferase involved in cell wall biosynthesis